MVIDGFIPIQQWRLERIHGRLFCRDEIQLQKDYLYFK